MYCCTITTATQRREVKHHRINAAKILRIIVQAVTKKKKKSCFLAQNQWGKQIVDFLSLLSQPSPSCWPVKWMKKGYSLHGLFTREVWLFSFIENVLNVWSREAAAKAVLSNTDCLLLLQTTLLLLTHPANIAIKPAYVFIWFEILLLNKWLTNINLKFDFLCCKKTKTRNNSDRRWSSSSHLATLYLNLNSSGKEQNFLRDLIRS